jgi:hypothetical protein
MLHDSILVKGALFCSNNCTTNGERTELDLTKRRLGRSGGVYCTVCEALALLGILCMKGRVTGEDFRRVFDDGFAR